MVEYYWEYWENEEVYSGEVDAQSEDIAYKLIQDILYNGVGTVQGGELAGVWAFTESEGVDVGVGEKHFDESDMVEVINRGSGDTLSVDRD